MAAQVNKETHKWTPEETRGLIRFRAENEHLFLKSKKAAKLLWETLIKELSLEGKVTSQQVSKKWENLKKKYKDLGTLKAGCGTEGDVTQVTWQYFDDMDEVLGGRTPVEPPVVVASFNADPDSVTSFELKTEEFEPTEEAGFSSGTPSPVAPPDSPTCFPKNKRRRKTNPFLDFLMEESAKEQRRHEESEAKMERFLNLLEKLIENILPKWFLLICISSCEFYCTY
ncbi:uncharacterized protein LOC103459362 [Poecilia reticulata]|uniref:uncharacterized protein LOC103459362 n=1 Tax=Poecilia reticulata TaxID=8081 RepID=UPI0004A4CED6|nr:PREDICTED: uncharacterized protein LOC103459362 [Poecilia reticulata]